MGRIKLLAKVIVFVAVLILIWLVLSYALVDDTKAFTRLTLHDFSENEGKIEILFVGPSTSMMGIDTETADECFGVNTFNVSTSSQTLDGTYYLCKEAIEKNPNLKQIYLNVSPGILLRNVGEVMPTAIITDYLSSNMRRLEYVWGSVEPEYRGIVLFPLIRDREDIFTRNPVEIIKGKDKAYRNYEPFSHRGLEYKEKGFVTGVRTPENQGGHVYRTEGIEEFREEDINEKEVRYLEKTVELCREKEIELIFFTAPYSDFYLQEFKNYDTASRWIKAFAREHHVEYYDFNLLRRDILNLLPEDFLNMDHLMESGAEKFTRVLGGEYRSTNYEGIFYDSYQEKKKEDKQCIYGIACRLLEARKLEFEVLLSDDYSRDGWQYSVEVLGTDGEPLEAAVEGNIISISQGSLKGKRIIITIKDDKGVVFQGRELVP